VNLAKYRKTQKELEESEERADQAEVAMSRLRAKNRTSVSVTRTPTVSSRQQRIVSLYTSALSYDGVVVEYSG